MNVKSPILRDKTITQQLRGTALLLLATVIWGFAFTAQSVGMEQMGPFSFQMLRCLLAAAVLVPCAGLLDRLRGQGRDFWRKWRSPSLWRSGILCGCALFVASSLQQLGLLYTDPGKAGFLTAMYIVLVPILGLFLGRKAPKAIFLSVALAVVGLFLLSYSGSAGINPGDLLTLGCALAFAVQITCVDRLAPGQDSLRLNCIQALTTALLSAPMVLLREQLSTGAVAAAWGSLLFAGVLSMGLAYSFQIMGQKDLEPATASLIMSLESVFAALGGWWLLGQRMSPRELLGCALVFAAVILSQWSPQSRKEPEKKV